MSAAIHQTEKMKNKTVYVCPYECPLGKRCIIVRNPSHTDTERGTICPVISKLRKESGLQKGKTPAA